MITAGLIIAVYVLGFTTLLLVVETCLLRRERNMARTSLSKERQENTEFCAETLHAINQALALCDEDSHITAWELELRTNDGGER